MTIWRFIFPFCNFSHIYFVYDSKVWKIWITSVSKKLGQSAVVIHYCALSQIFSIRTLQKFKKCTYSSHPYQVQQFLADWASWGWPAWLRGTWLQSPRWVWRPYAFDERSRIPYVTKIDMIEGTEKDLHFHSYFSKVHIFWDGHKSFKESPNFVFTYYVTSNKIARTFEDSLLDKNEKLTWLRAQKRIYILIRKLKLSVDGLAKI